VARFIEVMFQFLLSITPALTNGPHLLGGRCSRGRLLRLRVTRVQLVIVAHKSMVPPDTQLRKIRTTGHPGTPHQ
jgi:hypothetical protein